MTGQRFNAAMRATMRVTTTTSVIIRMQMF